MIMKVELDRKDIIALLRGTTPYYSVMDKIPEDLGYFVGGFNHEWHWKYITEDCPYTDEYLYDLYLMCKNSWK